MKQRFQRLARRLAADSLGATAIEYALIGALIAVVIIVGVAATGTSVAALFNRVATCVENATHGGTC